MVFSLSPFAPENLVSPNGFGSPVPRQPAHLHTQAESNAYLQDSSRLTRRRPIIYLNHHTPSGQSRAYRNFLIQHHITHRAEQHAHTRTLARKIFESSTSHTHRTAKNTRLYTHTHTQSTAAQRARGTHTSPHASTPTQREDLLYVHTNSSSRSHCTAVVVKRAENQGDRVWRFNNVYRSFPYAVRRVCLRACSSVGWCASHVHAVLCVCVCERACVRCCALFVCVVLDSKMARVCVCVLLCSVVRVVLNSKMVGFHNKKQACSDVESTNRCLLKSIELPEAFWCVSGSQGH